MTSADLAQARAALERARDVIARDLVELFGHSDVEARVEHAPRVRLVVEGPDGRFEVEPSSERFTRAEGRLGAHARIAFELLLASETPADLFEGYRPPSEARRRVLFDALKGYLDETLGGNPYYSPLLVIERGPAMLVYCDDEYALAADDGSHRGHGLLRWKVKRLLAYALTDADESGAASG